MTGVALGALRALHEAAPWASRTVSAGSAARARTVVACSAEWFMSKGAAVENRMSCRQLTSYGAQPSVSAARIQTGRDCVGMARRAAAGRRRPALAAPRARNVSTEEHAR